MSQGPSTSNISSSAKLALGTLIMGFWLFPNSPWAYALHLDRVELLMPGRLKPLDCAIILSCVFAVWLLNKPSFGSPTSKRLLWALIGVYLSTFGASIAADPANSSLVLTCTTVVESLGIGLLSAYLCRRSRSTLKSIAVLGAVLALAAAIDYMHKQNVMVSGTFIRAGGSFDQPLELATVLLIALPFLIYFGSEGSNAATSMAWLSGAGVTIAGVMLTISRGPIAASAAGCVLLFSSRDKWVRSAIGVATVFAAVSLLVNLVRIQGSDNQSSTTRSNIGRIVVWQDGLKVFEKHWLTGVGPGALDIPIHPQYEGMTVNEAAVHTSNLALQWVDELGVGGGILLLLFAWTIGSTIWQSDDPMARPISAAWIGVSLVGIFDVPFGTSLMLGPTMMVGALLGTTLMLSPKRADDPDCAVSSPKACGWEIW